MDIIKSLLTLIGGLALLIYGMKMLSSNLKKMAGGKLEQILVNATNNPLKGLIVGFVITVMTQSTTTTTVLVIGLVNSEILTLSNSIPIIMGTNIGSTINAQLLRLTSIRGDTILSLLSPAYFTPVLLVIGLYLFLHAKKKKTMDISSTIISLGILFTGMVTMVNAASSFSNSSFLGTFLLKLKNPILGILFGTFMTALIQSSTAALGILLALSTTGQIPFSVAVPLVIGQSLGACVTTILTSIGGNTNAKRVAISQIYFKFIGAFIITIGVYSYQHFIGFSFWNDVVSMSGIANFHILLHVIPVILLMPFTKQLVKLSELTIKEESDNENQDDSLMVLNKLDERVSNVPRIAITNCTEVVAKMGELAEANFNRSMSLLVDYDFNTIDKIEKCESIIDKMEEVVTKYLINLENLDISEKENRKITTLLKIEADFEKIGDYSYRLGKKFEEINDKEIKFSNSAIKELEIMYHITNDAIEKTKTVFREEAKDISIETEALRDLAETRREKYKMLHIRRLKKGKCSVESGIFFLEILSCCESIINHCLNISIAMSKDANKHIVTKHDYRRKLYNKYSNEIEALIKKYDKIYK